MKKPKSFDFSKKPVNPCFLMSVAKWIISFPDLRKRKFKLEKINMDKCKFLIQCFTHVRLLPSPSSEDRQVKELSKAPQAKALQVFLLVLREAP